MKKSILLLFVLTFAAAKVFGQSGANGLQNWYDNKYSMFIHFGVYSELGGVWHDKPVTVGYSEQIQSHGGIMSDYYEDVAATFNPVNWNADEIALLAKKAGMRSIVITSKHHDGFCIYHSKYTRFNIVDATPTGRDILKELSEACARHGLNFGLYFSLIDWRLHPWTSHNANPITPAHHDYNLKQIEELLTGYGKISELWFDMGSLTEQQSKELYDLVKRLQPDCMVSGRLGNNYYDFCVMGDNEYPNYKIDAPWQTPASVFHETWGYRSWQKRENLEGKTREKLLGLIKVVSRGGNYLLNIGPKGDGSVVPYEADVLTGIGEWLQKNGEAIYGTSANPFPEYYPWGEITTNRNRVYLIFSGEKTPVVNLPLASGKIQKAFILSEPDVQLNCRIKKEELSITIPESVLNSNDIHVAVIEFTGDFAPKFQNIIDTRLTYLSFENATKHYSYECIDYYNNHRSIVKQSWLFVPGRKSSVPEVFFTEGDFGKEVEFTFNGETEIMKLGAGEKLFVNDEQDNVKWTNSYIAGPFRGSFGRIHGHIENIDIQKEWGNQGVSWQRKTNEENRVETLKSRPRESIYVLHEIESKTACDALVALYSGEGIMVWLNGDNLVAHNNKRNSKLNPDVVLLPLKTGKNQLLIKFHNHTGYELSYKIDPQIEQVLYSKKLGQKDFQRKDINTLEMKLHNPETAHQDMKLSNIRIEF